METIGADLRQMQRTPLAASHVQALREEGKIATYPAGTFLARPGEPMDRFVYVEEGEIEVVNPYTDKRHLPSTIGPAQFMGEIAFLSGGAWSLPMRAVRETRVIEVPREAMLTLMSRIPEMSDIIITVFSARRRRQLDDRDGSLRLIGEDEDRNVRRIAEFASRNRIPYASLPLRSPEAEATALSCSIAPGVPAVIFGRDVVVTDPTPEKVARLLGLKLDFQIDETFDVLIVGGGPAGVAAGVYAGAEGLACRLRRGRRLLCRDRNRGTLLQGNGSRHHWRRQLGGASRDVLEPFGELRARAGPRGVACRFDVELPLQPARGRSQDLDRVRRRGGRFAWH
jgi:thioredoxin reductase (NADPH)